jgi:radical SAM superfamily enzyme YgiQ (UPF0313 family)
MANFDKVLLTWRIVRETLPDVPIDIGGHIVNDDDVTQEMIERLIEVSAKETFNLWEPSFEKPLSSGLSAWIEKKGCAGPAVTFVKRDGLEFYARMPGVGLKRDDVLYAPLISATFDKRALGFQLPETSSGLIIPDVGCPMRCSFCTTSAKFGGNFVKFLGSAEDLLAVADGHAARGISEMFVMSENFSLDTKRALALLKLMEDQHKPYSYSVFSSADALLRLGIENIVKLGYCFVWIGLEESTGSVYEKMDGVRLRTLISDLQAHGVEVLGSTILGFPHQTAADVDHEIEHALAYGCTYNQFMLYMAMPGTALWKQMKAENRIKEKFPWCDIHGQHTQNWKHPHIPDEVMTQKLDGAFARDFEVLGPSVLRGIETQFRGYRNTASWNHELVQMRRASMRKKLPFYAMLLNVMADDLKARGNATHAKARALRDEIIDECGWKTKLACMFSRPYVAHRLRSARRDYEQSVRLKQAPEPSCVVTHYGTFEERVSPLLPAPGPTPRTVSVCRPLPDKCDTTLRTRTSTAPDVLVSDVSARGA